MNKHKRKLASAAGLSASITLGLLVGPAAAQGGDEGPAIVETPREPSKTDGAPEPTTTRPEDPPLLQGGSSTPTPVVDGDIENVPNLTDIELAVARITISAQRAQANLSVAPLLIPGRYRSVASELRLGVSADSAGAFGLGAAIGYNQPRVRLSEYAADPAFCEPTSGASARDPAASRPEVKALDAEIESTLDDLCGLVAAACDGRIEGDAPCKNAVRDCAAPSAGSPSTKRAPAVLRLTKLLGRVELLKDAGTPPAPPKRPDRTIKDSDDYVALLAAYIQEATAFQGRRAALAALRAALPAARDLRARREKAGEASVFLREEGLVEQRQLCRLDAAYLRASIVTLGASVSFFPLYLGPAVEQSPAGGEARVANAHYLRRVDATAAYRFYPTRRVSAQLRGGFRAERASASEASALLWRALAGADLGFFAPIDDAPDPTGFQRGLGVGFSGTAWFCGAEGGCVTDVGLASPYSGETGFLPLSRRIQVVGFIEWRQAAALQIRAGIEARLDSVVGALSTSDKATTSPLLTRVIPTLALGSSFWGL